MAAKKSIGARNEVSVVSKASDAYFMKLALELAKNAHPSPNPRVGCVIVKNGRIVGRGFHEKPGMPHAEINALMDAGVKAKTQGATMYVTLEPCCIFGRTPPCTKAIISAGIKKVVVACLDQNPRVCGKGLAELKSAGIIVRKGVFEKEALELNETFFKHILTGLPYVAIKSAISSDGKISSFDKRKKWIGSKQELRHAHFLRAEYDAILVGINTVLKDNPRLTTRLVKGKNPLRVILDSNLKIPLDAKVLADNNVVIFTSKDCDIVKRKKLKSQGIAVFSVEKNKKTGQLDWAEILKILGEKEITSLLIEGGSSVIASALSQKIVDKAYLAFSPAKIGDGLHFMKGADSMIAIIKKLKPKHVKKQNLGKDLLIEAIFK